MSSTSKYIVYKCDVCQRESEIVLDGNRPDPIRCNITQKCRGKFNRVGERSAREFLFTPLVPGLKDYIPRGTAIIPSAKLSVPNPITVQTGAGNGIIAMAAIRKTVVGSNIEFSIIDEDGNNFVLETRPSSVGLPRTSLVRAVLFEISQELLTATKYTYVISGPVQTISGQDNSPESRSLRFNSTNKISLFVNGIELNQSAYDRMTDDQITFTPAIYDSNNVVEVFVYKDLSSAIENSKQIVLEFQSLAQSVPKELTLRELDAWGNYASTIINGVERFTLFCTDLTELDQNKNYGVAYFEAVKSDLTTKKVKTSEVFVLLAKEPFAFRDKELYAYLEGVSLVDLGGVMTYKISSASGQLFLTVDDSIITQVFNPIGLSKRLTVISTVIKPEATPGTALEGTENLKQKYILGPS